jgi:hypothetical protein
MNSAGNTILKGNSNVIASRLQAQTKHLPFTFYLLPLSETDEGVQIDVNQVLIT